MKVRYDRAIDTSPAALFGTLTDENFLETVVAGDDPLSFAVDVHSAGSLIITRVSRTLATAGMPAVARRFVGPSLELVEIVSWSAAGPETWQGDASVDVAAGGRQARFRGRASVQPRGEFADYALDGSVTIKIPLLGAAVEKMAGDALLGAIERQLTEAEKRIITG